MAIIPGSLYPSQTDTDGDYPQGKARNSGSYQDGTGTPLEKTWLNDLWGFQQALLDFVGATPSGDPDKVGASQYLDAIRSLSALRYAHYSIVPSVAVAFGDKFELAENPDSPNVANGFALSLSNDLITLPKAGIYLAIVNGGFRTSRAGTFADFGIKLTGNGVPTYPPAIAGLARSVRASSDTGDNANLTLLGVGKLAHTSPDTYNSRNKIGLVADTSSATVTASNASLFVLALG